MKYFEFGQENAELMVLLHGGPVGENSKRFIRVVDEACRYRKNSI